MSKRARHWGLLLLGGAFVTAASMVPALAVPLGFLGKAILTAAGAGALVAVDRGQLRKRQG